MATPGVEVSTKQENVLLEWISPSRPFKPRTREFYRTIGAIVLLIAVILLFIREFLLIGVVVATLFMFYVLSSVPPEKIKHKVTILGIESGTYFHRWEVLNEFWFDEKYGERMVVVRTLLGFPSHLHMLLGDVSAEKVRKLLSDKLPFREQVEKTWLDRSSDWLAKNVPLEKASS